MIVKSRKRFLTDLSKIKSYSILEEVEQIINVCSTCNSATEIPGYKTMTGYPGCARIAFGDYRIGIKLSGKTIIFMCLLHRSIVYKQFP